MWGTDSSSQRRTFGSSACHHAHRCVGTWASTDSTLPNTILQETVCGTTTPANASTSRHTHWHSSSAPHRPRVTACMWRAKSAILTKLAQTAKNHHGNLRSPLAVCKAAAGGRVKHGRRKVRPPKRRHGQLTHAMSERARLRAAQQTKWTVRHSMGESVQCGINAGPTGSGRCRCPPAGAAPGTRGRRVRAAPGRHAVAQGPEQARWLWLAGASGAPFA